MRERHSDMVWRLRWRDQERGWFYVYLLLEFQSTPDPFMAVRLLGYVALLLAGLVRTAAVPPRGVGPAGHAWLLRLLRRLLPGVTIPEVGELEEIPMLEETLIEWWNGARETGLQEGRREGLQEGLQEGKQSGQVEGMRRLLSSQLEQRFGKLPQRVRRRVAALAPAELEELARRILVAGSLAEMGLGQ
jgi:predicted transposase YdaD